MKRKPIPYGRQWIDEKDIQEVTKVLRSDFLTQGPTIERLEKVLARHSGTKYAVAFSSGTAALHAACFAAKIGSGDEVITTPLTFSASANCILYCGGKPIFVDTKQDLPLIDPKLIERKISEKTRAIISVDYTGMPADYDEINFLAKRHNLPVIADAAHSLGARYRGKPVGKLADMTVLSFHPVKLITTGEGGMVVTNNKDFFERLKIFRTHGITKDKNRLQDKTQGSWYYEMQELGYNYRLTDVHAALGLSQFKKLHKFLRRRQEIAQFYLQAFKNSDHLEVITVPKDRTSAWHLFPIFFNLKKLKVGRKQIFAELHKAGIKVQVHYIPIHLLPYYRKLFGYRRGDFQNAESFYERGISIPIFPKLSKQDIDYVILTLKRIVENHRK